MLWDFIKKYYIDSIVYKQGYNLVNTLTWAALLVIAVVVVYRYLKKRVAFDERFVLSNLPFIVLGSSVRIVEDSGFLHPPLSYLFMTPFIYILIFCVAFPSLLLAIRMRKERYWIHYGLIGVVSSFAILLLLFGNLEIINGWILPSALAIAALLTAGYRLVTAKLYRPMSNRLSCIVFFSHMVDGWATFFGIQFLGYWELHVLPRFLISSFGPWIMIPAKIVVFVAILYILDSSREDRQLVSFIKFVLVVLGLAPGLRDSLRMTFQV